MFAAKSFGYSGCFVSPHKDSYLHDFTYIDAQLKICVCLLVWDVFLGKLV